MKKSFALALIAALVAPLSNSLQGQGSLTPPAAPAPTMKTLQQIEPRIEINSTNTPGDADSIYKITQAGSYFLSANLTGVAGRHGIEIAAHDVTLDFGGFALIGVGGSLGGIVVTGSFEHLVLRNGSARGWGQRGIDAQNARGGSFENLRVAGNVSNGLVTGDNAMVTRCTARSNTGIGIALGSANTAIACTAAFNTTTGISGGGFSCTISGCTAESNTGVGIFANKDSTVSDCAARSNGSHGISVSDGCIVKGSASESNLGTAAGIKAGKNCSIIHCSASANPSHGIDVGDSAHVEGSTASGNSGRGILVTRTGTVTGCTADTNAQSGIVANAGGMVIADCATYNNTGTGIDASNGSSITGCTATGNSDIGIASGDHSSIINCAALNNGSTGILARDPALVSVLGQGCAVINCSARGNRGAGIATGSGSTVEGCASDLNDGSGFSLGDGATIRHCDARSNGDDGIVCNQHSLVLENNSNLNGTNAGGSAGILVEFGQGTRVEGNNVAENDRGIEVVSDRNIIVRNTCRNNAGHNYVIAAGNRFGQVIVPVLNGAAVDGDAPAGGFTSTDPWANFSY
jgi:parallel beta-helix repeat protein